MKSLFSLFGVVLILFTSCSHDGYVDSAKEDKEAVNILFLHHSTGNNIYKGVKSNKQADVQSWFDIYNQENSTNYNFVEQAFPLSKKLKYIPGYGWRNYPYDYYNIWVKNGDKGSYKYEPTLKTLAPLWDVIIFKHCYPVSAIEEDGVPNINSDKKTLANYKLQYDALKDKMKEFPETKFIVWTGAALVESKTTEERAKRAKAFFNWVKEEWDEEGDNIFIWDFYELETEGGLYLKSEYAKGLKDSHPNAEFSAKVAPLFSKRITDVIEHNGMRTSLTGQPLLNIESVEE